MLAPELVLQISVNPTAFPASTKGSKEPLLKLLLQCFGAQAVMCGLLLLVSKMDRRAYAIWGAAILPFFWFDIIAWKRGVLTNLGALGDAVGNVIFLTCTAYGAGWTE
jgi:hypothetical protein